MLMIIDKPEEKENIGNFLHDFAKDCSLFEEFLKYSVMDEIVDDNDTNLINIFNGPFHTEILKAYKENKELAESCNDEFLLETWWDLDSGESVVTNGLPTFEDWIKQGLGSIGRNAFTVVILAAFCNMYPEINMKMFLDYGGEEDWYIVGIQLDDWPETKRYYSF